VRGGRVGWFHSLHPQRLEFFLGDKAVLIRIELIEERGGEFVFAEFAIAVGVALLEEGAWPLPPPWPSPPLPGSVLDWIQVMLRLPAVSA
jgi:hypothetical protein